MPKGFRTPSKEELKKQKERDYKIYSTTDEEKHALRQALATIGYFNAAIEGLELKLQFEQAKIERRVGADKVKAKEGYRMQTMIDPETLNLFVREMKIIVATPAQEQPTPAKEEKK